MQQADHQARWQAWAGPLQQDSVRRQRSAKPEFMRRARELQGPPLSKHFLQTSRRPTSVPPQLTHRPSLIRPAGRYVSRERGLIQLRES